MMIVFVFWYEIRIESIGFCACSVCLCLCIHCVREKCACFWFRCGTLIVNDRTMNEAKMSKQHSRCERYGKGWRLKKGEIPQTQRIIIWIRVLCINNNDVLFALCTTTTITRSKIIIHTMCEQNICEPIWLIAAHCSIYNEIFSSIRLRLYECDLRIRVCDRQIKLYLRVRVFCCCACLCVSPLILLNENV